MLVFVTGATGWIGSATTTELLAAGHTVLGLARSEESAARLRDRGAEALLGDLDDLAALRAGAKRADAVIHLANKHDFVDMAATNRTERAAVQTLLDVLAGSDRAFLVASGVAYPTGRLLTEHDAVPYAGPDAPRGGTEVLALEYAERGVRSVALRFSTTVHGEGDHGFIAVLADIARRHGVAGYVGDGANRWPAVHISDAGRLVALALEKAPAGSAVHAVAEEGVPARVIAEGLAEVVGVPTRSIAPEDAAEHFGWIGGFFGMDVPASNAITRELLDWTPTGPTLLADLKHYA
jgi:nucleoside-diphosphate-sugar epimerase